MLTRTVLNLVRLQIPLGEWTDTNSVEAWVTNPLQQHGFEAHIMGSLRPEDNDPIRIEVSLCPGEREEAFRDLLRGFLDDDLPKCADEQHVAWAREVVARLWAWDVTDLELATIQAALRYWQATDGGTHNPSVSALSSAKALDQIAAAKIDDDDTMGLAHRFSNAPKVALGEGWLTKSEITSIDGALRYWALTYRGDDWCGSTSDQRAKVNADIDSLYERISTGGQIACYWESRPGNPTT